MSLGERVGERAPPSAAPGKFFPQGLLPGLILTNLVRGKRDWLLLRRPPGKAGPSVALFWGRKWAPGSWGDGPGPRRRPRREGLGRA